MNSNARKAALEILLLLENYTSDEIKSALDILDGKIEGDFIYFLQRKFTEKTESRSRDVKKETRPSKKNTNTRTNQRGNSEIDRKKEVPSSEVGSPYSRLAHQIISGSTPQNQEKP